MIRRMLMEGEGSPPAADPTPPTPASAPDAAKPEDRPAVDWQARAKAAGEKVRALGAKASQADIDAAATAQQIAALTQRAEASDKAALTARRDAALERAGVLAQYRDTAPLVDPTTQEGAQALEKWLADRPQIRVAQQAGSGFAPPPPESTLAKIANGTSSLGKAGQDWYRNQMERAHG